MSSDRRCEICGHAAEKHHIVSRGAGGTDEPWNLLNLCRMHHRHFHDVGWVKFLGWYPHLRAKVLEARRTANKHLEARV